MPQNPLSEIPFFQGLPDQLLWHLNRAAERVEYAPDDRLFRNSEPRKALWVILDGQLAIEAPFGDIPTRFATLAKGDVVGENLLLEETVHHTVGRVVLPLTTLRFAKEALGPLLKDQPRLYAALVTRAAKIIAGRLKAADISLSRRDQLGGVVSGPTRSEKDLLGTRDVPEAALYGIQTLRAIENFPITGVLVRDFPELIIALAQVKEAAASANLDLGQLAPDVADAIIRACNEIEAGNHHDHFRVDMVQGGAGTSTNMNANEVIANRALELLGEPRGNYARVHPNEHVNKSQSTNDVYPTAVRLALHYAIGELQQQMRALVQSLRAKGEEFAPHIKMGRTQLQDAVPMTLGQEFTAFANTIAEDVDRLEEAKALIREINMGATAIGTRITAPPGYTEKVTEHLCKVTGLQLQTAPDLVEATSDTGAFVQLSGVLKRCAVKLSKVCNDLRLLASGPRAGFSEIRLPAVQPGSSIMPGKVNPVIPEAVNQVCFDIIGGDITVTMAAEAGQLQLNVFEPIITFRLLRNISALTNATKVLRLKCVDGIEANPERMRDTVERSIGLVTALLPALGYERCTALAREALESGRGVAELVLEQQLMTREELDAVLDPASMASGGHRPA